MVTASRMPLLLHHGPELQRLHCHFAEGCRRRVAGPPEHRGSGGYGGECPAGPAAGWTATQLVVGYLAAQGDSYLAVYSYENGTVNAILEQSYEQYLVEDITGGGRQDLILMSTLEDGGVQIEAADR